MFATVMLAIALNGPAGSEFPSAPPPREKHLRPTVYVGEVMAVTNRSITIRGKDQCDKDGRDIIRTFQAGPHLAKGEQDPREDSNSDYRLSDVKVGDKVITKLRAVGDNDVCLAVSIRRRPGGLVPPAPFEKADVPHKYHIDANAYQAHEERGVPLPLRLDEIYQRASSETHARMVDERFKQKERIAPPPRPVVRK